jgi:hypothetical protein
MPTNRSSRNVTREAKRRREDSPVVAVAPLEENQPKKKPARRRRNWDESFQALVEYKKQNGNCNVPQKYKDDIALGHWVSMQRFNRYCSKKLTPEKKGKLTQLGFNWETLEERDERAWNEFFQRLKAYRREYLDCCVPQGFKEDPALGKWVSTQRALDKRGKLPAHRKEKLESVKFTWSINASQSKRDTSTEDAKWFAQYNVLVEFHKKHGHCLVTVSYEQDKSLGIWVTTQRTVNQEGRMRPDRFQLLEDIEFVWKVDVADPEASLHQRHWDEMYQNLVEFQENNISHVI